MRGRCEEKDVMGRQERGRRGREGKGGEGRERERKIGWWAAWWVEGWKEVGSKFSKR